MAIQFLDDVRFNGEVRDTNGLPGTSGQILSSTITGTSWVDAPASGISGSGAAGQVTFWSGTSAVTGENDLYWDSTNNALGIGTNTPNYPLHVVDEGPALRLDVGSFDVGTISQKGGTLSLYAQTSSTIEGQIQLVTVSNSTSTNVAQFQNTGRLVLQQYGSGTFTGTAQKMLAVDSSGNVIEETLPGQTLTSNFSHDASTGTYVYMPFGTLTDTTSLQYYNTFVAPKTGRVRKIVLKNAGVGTAPSMTSTTLRVIKNSGIEYTSSAQSTLAANNQWVSVTLGDSDATFVAGDKLNFAFDANGLWRGATATIIVEYTD